MKVTTSVDGYDSYSPRHYELDYTEREGSVEITKTEDGSIRIEASHSYSDGDSSHEIILSYKEVEQIIKLHAAI